MFAHAARTFEPTDHAPRQARLFVKECLAAWGLTGITDPLVLAVSELTTNAVTHGTGAINVTLRTNDRRVRIQVENLGAGTPVMRAPESPERITGGMGLRLVDTVADDWGVDARANTTSVWFEHGLQVEPD